METPADLAAVDTANDRLLQLKGTNPPSSERPPRAGTDARRRTSGESVRLCNAETGETRGQAGPRRKPLVLALKLALGTALIGLLIWSGRFDPRAYGALLHLGTAVFLLGVLLGQWIMLLVPFVRWWLLVRAQGLPISLGEAFRLGLMGAFANLFVPGGLGIDGLRLVHLRRFHRGKWIPGAASVFMDRALGLASLLLLAGACSALLLLQSYSGWVMRFVLINAVLFGVLLVILALLCGFLGTGLFPLVRRIVIVDRGIRAMQVYRGHGRVLVWGLLLSLVGHCGLCISVCFALWSLGYHASPLAVFTVTPIVVLARTVPVAPLGLGVSDGVAAFLYPLVGLQGGAEVQMLLRGTITLVFLTCGIAYLRGHSEIHSAQQPSGQTVTDEV